MMAVDVLFGLPAVFFYAVASGPIRMAGDMFLPEKERWGGEGTFLARAATGWRPAGPSVAVQEAAGIDSNDGAPPKKQATGQTLPR